MKGARREAKRRARRVAKRGYPCVAPWRTTTSCSGRAPRSAGTRGRQHAIGKLQVSCVATRPLCLRAKRPSKASLCSEVQQGRQRKAQLCLQAKSRLRAKRCFALEPREQSDFAVLFAITQPGQSCFALELVLSVPVYSICKPHVCSTQLHCRRRF